MSSTFTITRDQVIQLALRKLGVLDLGETPDTVSITNASFSLNLFIKQMATQGLKLWKINNIVLPLVTNQTKYTIGPPIDGPVDLDTDKPLKVIQAWLRNTSVTPNIDIPLMALSQQEYNTLGSKFSTGVANSYYYQVRNKIGELYVYLTPDSGTAEDYEVYLTVQQPMDDLNKAQEIPDFPNEWMNTLVWNLADQLAIEYSVPANHRQEIAQRAKMYRDELTDWDVEVTSTYFQPNMRMLNTYGNVS